MIKKHDLEFDILQDLGNETANDFGLRYTLPDYLQEVYLGFQIDLSRVNGEDSWTLPMPARYIVDQNGIIVAADFDPDYTYRPEPRKSVEDLMKIN